MTGFPGEIDAEHRESIEFARTVGFDGLHVFRYSLRPGTEAAAWKACDPRVVLARADEWRALDASRRAAHAARAVGCDRVVAPSLDGREGVTEDFLTAGLDAPIRRGLMRVRVMRANEGRAFAKAL